MIGNTNKQMPEKKEKYRDTRPVQQQTLFPSRDLRKIPHREVMMPLPHHKKPVLPPVRTQ